MKIYQLMCFQSDISSGNSETILETTKNKQQLESIAVKLNKKYGSSPKAEDYITEFSVQEIDTNTIPDTLTKSQIDNLWN
jgi:hypothetical protein